MANTIVTPQIFAKMAVRILENELVMAKLVYRGYEAEFEKKVNGYDVGDTISIRKPQQFRPRIGAVAQSPIPDITEGKLSMQVSRQVGVDFSLSSQELTMKLSELGDRVIKPGMVTIANQVDQDLTLLYRDVWNWVGTPNTTAAGTIDSFKDFALAPQRLDEMAVPADGRAGVLSPADNWAIAGSATALYMQNVAQQAYRKGSIGELGDVDTYMSQNVQTHQVWNKGAGKTLAGANQNVAYLTVKDTEAVPGTQTLLMTGFTATQTPAIKKGDVFNITGVYAVNPVTKAVMPYLQQFVVQADANSDGSGNVTATIAPAIILADTPANAPWQTVYTSTGTLATGLTVTQIGTDQAGYPQNMVFHKNAFALVVVPMVRPPGAVDVARESYHNLSVRVIPYYDGPNDVSKWRLDILYGVKTVDARLATRVSGSP